MTPESISLTTVENRERRLKNAACWLTLISLTTLLTWPGFHQAIGHIPEEVRRVAIATEMTSSGDLNPHWFGHPGSLLIYTLAAAYKTLESSSRIGLAPINWADIRTQYLTDPTLLFLIGRVIARLSAVVAVIATFEVGARMMPRPWAFGAALLTALNPIFVMHAHRLRSDHILSVALLLGAACLGSIDTARKPAMRSYSLAALAGVAVTFKYTAASILAAQLLAFTARGPRNPKLFRELAQLIGVACMFSFFASPFLWLDLPTSLRDMAWEASKKGSWNPAASLWKITTVLRYGFGELGFLSITALASVGMVNAIRAGWANAATAVAQATKTTSNAAVLILGIYLSSTLLASSWNATWMAPIIPLITLLLVEQFRSLQTADDSEPSRRAATRTIRPLILAAITTSIVLTQIGEVQTIAAFRNARTTIASAEAWLAANLEPESRVLLWQPQGEQDGFFPRVRVPGIRLYRVNEADSIERICQGDQGTAFETQKHLREENCYPRPRIRSQPTNTSQPDISQIDYIVVSSRKAPSSQVLGEVLKSAQPAAEFTRPTIKPRLSYPPPTNFPHGDYASWVNLQIYRVEGVSHSHP